MRIQQRDFLYYSQALLTTRPRHLNSNMTMIKPLTHTIHLFRSFLSAHHSNRYFRQPAPLPHQEKQNGEPSIHISLHASIYHPQPFKKTHFRLYTQNCGSRGRSIYPTFLNYFRNIVKTMHSYSPIIPLFLREFFRSAIQNSHTGSHFEN